MIAKAKDSPHEPVAYGTCRVSSDRQQKSGLGLESQDAMIREYHARRFFGEPVKLAEISIDAISAYKKPFLKRPEASRICKLLREGDHLIVAKHDRMFRSMLDVALTYKELVEDRGIVLHVVNLNFDTSKSDSVVWGKMLLHVFSALAEYESAINAQRQRDINAIRRQEGRYCGLKPKLGYTAEGKPGKRMLVPFEQQRDVMRWIAEQKSAGHTFKQILRELRSRNLRRPVQNLKVPRGFDLDPWENVRQVEKWHDAWIEIQREDGAEKPA